MNSSPPLILRKFQGFGGIWANSGKFRKFREISEKFRGIQWNSVGFCMALSMNSVGIPGGIRGNAGFRENLGFGVVSGDVVGQKAFAQIARTFSGKQHLNSSDANSGLLLAKLSVLQAEFPFRAYQP